MQAPVPLVGHELANERQHVIAEAELAWPESQLVLLTAAQDDMATKWMEAGWSVLLLSEEFSTVADVPWIEAVASKLNLNISTGNKA
jgi:hypothetical protein